MKTNQDDQHLNLLSILHFVMAAMAGLLSLFPVIHLVLGISILSGAFEPPSASDAPPPEFLGWTLVALASFFILAGLTFAACIAIAGLKLRRRRSHLYCMIIAGACCFIMPIGTALGVFTLIILMKPEVRAKFGLVPTEVIEAEAI